MEINITEASLEHLDALLPLFEDYRRFYNMPPDPAGARTFLQQRLQFGESVVYLALDAEAGAVGFVQLYPLFSSTRLCRLWLLNDLFVAPAHRGRGIARQLIEVAKDLARDTRAAGLQLETARENTAGNTLYLATGFEPDTGHNFYFWPNDQR